MKWQRVIPAMTTQFKPDLNADRAATPPVRPTITQRANKIQTIETRAL
jgi:hypothetical protein